MKYLIEGLDRLGKDTLIDGILNKFGYHVVLHYSKPKKLQFYGDSSALYGYQRDSFAEMFKVLRTPKLNVIMNRAHLGECVYSPLYRGYPGEYVFKLEEAYEVDKQSDVRLVLLTEDFRAAAHFVDDGESLGSIEARADEQWLFLDAFGKSKIVDKRIVCVTDPSTGQFKPKEQILAEVVQ